jgi:hypothetical protein
MTESWNREKYELEIDGRNALIIAQADRIEELERVLGEWAGRALMQQRIEQLEAALREIDRDGWLNPEDITALRSIARRALEGK